MPWCWWGMRWSALQLLESCCLVSLVATESIGHFYPWRGINNLVTWWGLQFFPLLLRAMQSWIQWPFPLKCKQLLGSAEAHNSGTCCWIHFSGFSNPLSYLRAGSGSTLGFTSRSWGPWWILRLTGSWGAGLAAGGGHSGREGCRGRPKGEYWAW